MKAFTGTILLRPTLGGMSTRSESPGAHGAAREEFKFIARGTLIGGNG
jgi:hypothetical protein